MCPDSHEIVLSELTDSKQTDGKVGKKMAKKIPKNVKTAFGDGAYDRGPFYQELYEHGDTGNHISKAGWKAAKAGSKTVV